MEQNTLPRDFGRNKRKRTAETMQAAAPALKHRTAYTSAVVMMPPPHIWPPLQAIRETHDRGFVRWPPHVTLLYPFVVDEHFAEATEVFEKELASFQPFPLRLSTFNHFKHSKGYTVWIHPDDSQRDDNPMKKLQAILEAQYPYCDEQSARENGFTPHLTVGQSQTKKEMEEHLSSFQKAWTENQGVLDFEVKEVYLISRTATDPFEVRAVIPLGSGKDTPPHFQTHPIPVREKKTPSQAPNATAFVGNLPFTVNDEKLAELFNGYSVVSAKVITQHGKRSKGFGFVEFANEAEKNRAIQEMNEYSVGERKLVVKSSNPS